MTNANCLEGYCCPDCGQDDRLLVVGVAEFTATDDGSEAVGDHGWGDDSPARCPVCGRGGALNDFRVPTDLPPDPEGMNDDRAGWAGAALAAFRAETGADREDAPGDLLADLMHWCDRAGFDFGAALDRARMHYEAETLTRGRRESRPPRTRSRPMTVTRRVNPFYTARVNRTSVDTTTRKHDGVQYARLPRAPRTASPVPHLTSLYHFDRAGEYGDRAWPGNCGGNLIKDLLLYFRPGLVFDPMSGSGTCADVCRELAVPCVAWDVHAGFDACDPAAFPGPDSFDFVWCHPPYWRQKLYADDPRDLSRSPTLDHFLRRYGQFLRNAARSLKPGGKLAVLMGDYADRAEGFVPLTYHTKRLAFAAGLRQHCTDIVRFSHGASSGKKVYRSSFIPGLHDTCVVFERPAQRAGLPADPVAGSAQTINHPTTKGVFA